MAWLVTYCYLGGKQLPHLVYTNEHVQKLLDEKPSEVVCRVREVARDELARPDEGDESI